MDIAEMKTLLALILIPSLLLADGVVLFEKSTGILQDKYVQQVVTNSDDGVVSTNTLCAFAKLQPRETTAAGNRVLGAQVLKGVKWDLFDLASFTGKHPNPQTTNDLIGVVRFNVLETQATEKDNPDFQLDPSIRTAIKALIKTHNQVAPPAERFQWADFKSNYMQQVTQ